MKYKVLVVDDDTCSLLVLRASLQKWSYYDVTTANSAQEALTMLSNNSYDLVLSDVHMPGMNGLQLLEHVTREFNLPVILISADEREEIMLLGMKKGAQYFMQKPVLADEVRCIFMICESWKRKRNNIIAPVRQIEEVDRGNSNDENNNAGGMTNSATENIADTENMADDNRKRRIVWKSYLHNRFVEAILVIGYQRAVPSNILEVMNVQGLTRSHVMSHFQKFQNFLRRVLNDDSDIGLPEWADLNYFSSVGSGNPTLKLIDLLREEQRKGNLDAQNPLRLPNSKIVRAPNGSSSSCHLKLPPLAIPGLGNSALWNSKTAIIGGSVGRSTASPHNANYMTNQMGDYCQNAGAENQDYSCMGVTVERNTSSIYNASYMTNQMGNNYQNMLAQNQNCPNIGGSLWEANNANMGSTSATRTSLSYGSNQMGYCSQDQMAQQQYYPLSGGQVGGGNNNIFTSTNIVAPFSVPFYSQQSINVAVQANNNFFTGNNFDSHKETQAMEVKSNQVAAENNMQVTEEDVLAHMYGHLS